MNQSKIIITILTILALVFSYSILNPEIKTFERTEEDVIVGVLSMLGNWFLKLLLIGVTVLSVIQIIRNRKFGFFFPLSISIMCFVISTLIWYKFETRESSPVILKAHYDGDINGLTLFLRANKTYKLENFSFLGGTCYYGEYIIKSDTIILSEKYPLGIDNRNNIGNKLLKVKEFILIKQDSNGRYDANEYFKLRIINKKSAETQ
jgi:hypothetical protein